MSALSNVCRMLCAKTHARKDILELLGSCARETVIVEDVSMLLSALRASQQDPDMFEHLIPVAVKALKDSPQLWTTYVASCFCEIVKRLHPPDLKPVVTAQLISFCCQLCGIGALRMLFFDCCPHLPKLLRHEDHQVQEASSTFVQVLCCGSIEIESFLCSGGCEALSSLLHSPKPTVITKSLQSCHALSRDINFCRELCECGVVPVLTLLTGCLYSGTVAAGILQNVAREKSSYDVLESSEAVESVTALLLDGDPSSQAAALGFLLNLHNGSDESRRALVEVLKSAIVEQCVAECVH